MSPRRAERHEPVSDATISVDGAMISCRTFEPIAAALIRAGIVTLKHTRSGAPRGIFCGIGVCQDCLVTVDGVANCRACMTLVQHGQVIVTGA